MATEKPGTADGFLAMIEAKIAALQTLAASYRAAVSVGALGPAGDVDLSGLTAAPTRQKPSTNFSVFKVDHYRCPAWRMRRSIRPSSRRAIARSVNRVRMDSGTRPPCAA